MLNDRFNGGDQNDFKNKFRDKKFVSTVAIGIFVLILLIVLFARGCKSKPQPKQQPKPPVPVVAGNPGAPAEVAPAVTSGNDNVVAPRQPDLPDDRMAGKQKQIDENKAKGRKLIQEGIKYYNQKNYKKAKECFQKAKALGATGADALLKKCK